MAGMLPGVESARRRRTFHSDSQNPFVPYNSTRRSSFCLYTSNHEVPITSSSSKMRDPISHQSHTDEEMDAVARQAKLRLDERLTAHWKSQPTTKRVSSGQQMSRTRKGGHMLEGTKPLELLKKKFSFVKILPVR